MEQTYDINPFERTYYEQEKEWFLSKCKEVKTDRLSIEYKDIHGRLDGFLYMDFLELKNVPIFYIDGKVWMSITPMEVESHYIPIECASGNVGVAGLGLGYYVQRILDKEDVDAVTVYELDQDVIDLYLELFGDHPKLTIVQGDVLETCKNGEFNWFYNDIYANMCEDVAFEHMKILLDNNYIEDYHFWTMEAYALGVIGEGDTSSLPFSWRVRFIPFLRMLLESKGNLAQYYVSGDTAIELIENFT